MISTNNFHTGLTIDIEEGICTVMEFLHVKPGKGSAFVRTRLRNIETGAVFEKTFRAGEKVKKAHLEEKEMEFLYQSEDQFFFMDRETFDQTAINEEDLGGDIIKFLKENLALNVKYYQGRAVTIELPIFVELEVTQTDPGVKGNTVSGGTKPARLETGVEVNVPLFINEGDNIKVDTRSGEYMERVSR